MKIIDQLSSLSASDLPYFSFEYFPPKTDAGVENLYGRMERMTSLRPLFVDITWGAGGITKDLTLSICKYAQKYLGVSALLHLTCTQQTRSQIREVLVEAKEMGIKNVLALRGDPPKGANRWEYTPNGFNNAIEEEFGDYFCIAVAGFPEGHPFSGVVSHSISPPKGGLMPSPPNLDADIDHLKAKIDQGADFILTQFFYDPDVFVAYVHGCRAAGITCPIIPGMMPIQSYSSFQKMTSFCRTSVPAHIWAALSPIKNDDEAVKAFGIQLCSEMCRTLEREKVANGFHFYTLNLENSVLSVLTELGVGESAAARRSLPWRGSRNNLKGMGEDVRPINWANRPKSYIARTNNWDDFPNGRWGDGRSPAFGELSETHFFRPALVGSADDRLAMWGEAPLRVEEVYEVFEKYVSGQIPILPWSESSPQTETGYISSPLESMNHNGFLTINSQPAVNGEKSDHKDFGWGGAGGRVYQKAYVEFFTSQDNLKLLMQQVTKYPSMNLYAIDSSGVSHFCGEDKGVTALTWGVFPNKEVLQPTVFDPQTFEVWSQEAFGLWVEGWASLYDDDTDSCELLHQIHDTFFLVAIVDNDYFESQIFHLFDEVAELAKMSVDQN